MICKKCNGKGYIYTNAFGTKGILRCDVCGGNGKILSNQQTNEEWFESLDTEQLAEWLVFKRKLLRIPETNYEVWIQWLKEKHK